VVRTAAALWRGVESRVFIASASNGGERPMAPSEIAAMIFWSAQGAVVFTGAYAGLSLTGRTGARAKLGAMAISYLAWMLATALIYGRLGGGAPLVVGDGAFLVALFLTALLSSAALLLLWLLWPARQATRITWP
jgi:hypothetical protein